MSDPKVMLRVRLNDALDRYLPGVDLDEVNVYRREIAGRVDSDPLAALQSFGPILEQSILDVVEWCDPPAATALQVHKKGLSQIITVLKASIKGRFGYDLNHSVDLLLEILQVWRNDRAHAIGWQQWQEDLHFAAHQVATYHLHWMVWKLVCVAPHFTGPAGPPPPRTPQDQPPTLADADLAQQLAAVATQACHEVVSQAPLPRGHGVMVDPLGVATVKGILHELSEFVAQEAAERARMAVEQYPEEALSLLVPLVVQLAWRRGYAEALRLMLAVPRSHHHLSDYELTAAQPPCPLVGGRLSAAGTGDGQVTVSLDGHPAAIVSGVAAAEVDRVIRSVTTHGRLGAPRSGGQTLIERLGQIELRGRDDGRDDLALALYRNREALIPLLARAGMPDGEWWLPVPGLLPRARQGAHPLAAEPAGAGRSARLRHTDEIFNARRPWRSRPEPDVE